MFLTFGSNGITMSFTTINANCLANRKYLISLCSKVQEHWLLHIKQNLFLFILTFYKEISEETTFVGNFLSKFGYGHDQTDLHCHLLKIQPETIGVKAH